MRIGEETFPQGLKHGVCFAALVARLKSCPFKATKRLKVFAAGSARSVWICIVALATLIPACRAIGENSASAPTAKSASIWREASLAEYRQHLGELNAIVEACAKTRDTKSCDPALAGQDDHVPLGNAPNAEQRLVSYDWLRALLSKAQEKEEPAKTPATAKKSDQSDEPATPPKPTTSQLLQAAQTRLTHDIAQADSAAATQSAAPPDHGQQREAMKQVLAGRDFRNLEPAIARDSFWEKIGEWLNRFWASAGKLTDRAAWVGRLIVWGFIVAVCVGLVWGLMQLERRWRIRLVPDSDAPSPGAASARDWQLWLKDARSSAAGGQWREAVHFVYWAAISRLESKRLWPADRARTPREYLALVAAEDPRRAGLATLTGSFERTWYGGRAAAESDYLKAEELASELIMGGSASGPDANKGGGR
jgi:hypothetical protein